ncbi:MAG: sigma-54-dependent transcriptional regulator [bacterium]
MNPSVLIIEDDALMRKSLANFCKQSGHTPLLAEDGGEGLALFRSHRVDVVLLDMRLPDATGTEIMAQIHQLDDEVAVIMMTAFPDLKSAVETIKNGAFDYVTKPFEVAELRQTINKALQIRALKSEVLRLQRKMPDDGFPEMLGTSPAIQKVKTMIAKVGPASAIPVLVTGESGTGKELTANAVHATSARRAHPLVKINCSALPDHLLESELFGYEKGAFTGATQRKPGLFELANEGTLFLDEISEMQLNMQPKLLRILEGHPFKRLGGTKDIHVDVRIIAASNKKLETLVKAGAFREDLYYRLSAFIIELPTLQERRDDILLFAHHFLTRSAADLRKKIEGFSEEARKLLKHYHWPGNVRELRNIVERAVILCDEPWITSEHLPGQLLPDAAQPIAATLPGADWSLAELERRHILWVLEQVAGNKAEAVRRLGIARSTFDEKLKKYRQVSDVNT